MVAVTRPYFMIFNGAPRMVEAPNPASAVRHVVGAAVTELRPARGAEVAAWVREKKEIELAGSVSREGRNEEQGAGTEADETVTAGGIDLTPLIDEAVCWIEAQPLAEIAKGTAYLDVGPYLRRVIQAGSITLEDFDLIRATVPAFGDALVWTLVPIADGEQHSEADLQALRGQLEETPFPAEVVLSAIGDQIRKVETQADPDPAA